MMASQVDIDRLNALYLERELWWKKYHYIQRGIIDLEAKLNVR